MLIRPNEHPHDQCYENYHNRFETQIARTQIFIAIFLAKNVWRRIKFNSCKKKLNFSKNRIEMNIVVVLHAMGDSIGYLKNYTAGNRVWENEQIFSPVRAKDESRCSWSKSGSASGSCSWSTSTSKENGNFSVEPTVDISPLE